jgi:hypothetical protein
MLAKGDKIVLFSKDFAQRPLLRNIKRKTKKFQVVLIGVTTKQAYLPVDNHSYFENLYFVDWLRQWVKTEEERDEVNIVASLVK